MSLIKWQKGQDIFPSMQSFFDDLWKHDFYGNIAAGTTVPAVNITDEKDHFKVELAAPGFKREDFKVNLENNILTISSRKTEKKEEKEEKKITRREYNYSSFSRSFTLPDNVVNDKIKANYENGVLSLTLPKKYATKNNNIIEIAIS